MSRTLRHPITLRPDKKEALVHISDSDVLIVDIEDVSIVEDYEWFLNCKGYAVARKGKSLIGAHRLIAQHYSWDLYEKHVDHKNGNRLDCRKANLRPVTRQMNNTLRRKPENQSLPTGVMMRIGRGGEIRYRAQTHYEGRTVHAGTYDTIEQAVEGRRRKMEELYYDTSRPKERGTDRYIS